MTSKIIRTIIFLIIFGLFCLFPLRQVFHYEFSPDKPVEMKFHVRTTDPYDSWKQYISLIAEPTTGTFDVSCKTGRQYAVLGKDEKGFGKVCAITGTIPEGNVFVQVDYFGKRTTRNQTREQHFRLPFDRYIPKSFLSHREERLLTELTREYAEDVVLTVQIYPDGSFRCVGLTFDGKEILQLLAERKTLEKGKKHTKKMLMEK